MSRNAANAEVENWDAGDLGCGLLAVGLKDRLNDLRVGDLLEVKACNAGARVDIPSWCRLAGQALVSAQPPRYLILKMS
jgi:TusA-related sulfurtransferase